MRGKKAFSDLLKVVVSTLVVFLILEGAIRVTYFARNSMVDYFVLPYNAAHDFGPVPPWVDGLRILQQDESLSWSNRPGVQRRYMDVYSPVHMEQDRTELLRSFWPHMPPSLRGNPTWEVSINSAGFRDTEFSKEKRSSALRIICLGDSWTFGANVDQKDAYPQRLGALLPERLPAADFEVLNLGVLAYSSYQGLELLKTTLIDLTPDVALIGYGMNDASVAGYRDKDMPLYRQNHHTIRRMAIEALNNSEITKLLRYFSQIINYKPFSIGDYMQKVATAAGTPDEAWIGREGNEAADYEQLEPYTRVSPRDYGKNIVEMIDLARRHKADVILLYNELWNTPYRTVLEQVSKVKGVPLVDSKSLIDRARNRIEENLEAQLGLQPSTAGPAATSGEVQVIFRVYSDDHPVPRAIYIAGVDPKLGNGAPNQVAMYDDGTHGDQRAADKVWSYAASFSPGTRLFYVYTNSGERGRWEGLDVPHIRTFKVEASHPNAAYYRPIESFGRIYMQADGWHTNASGYKLIAEAVLQTLEQNAKVITYLEGLTHVRRDIRMPAPETVPGHP